MNDEEILVAVKHGLKELSNYNDDEIKLWIKLAIDFIIDAGTSPEKARSERAIGVITSCVDHFRLRENFSQVTLMLVSQLALGGD